jgi:serine/threonine protein kinase
VVARDVGQCPSCHAIPPTGAWPLLSECEDRWLGRSIADRYLIEQRIGTGSVGVIYRVVSRSLGRSFALKTVTFDKEDMVDKARAHVLRNLRREIELQSQIKNPHVVHLFDVLELNDDCIGILMDLVDGATLQQLVESNGALPIERACTILRQAAIGVHEVHEAGMVHRDLKPHNLMVETLPSGEDFARVLDFGIMCLQEAVDSTRAFAGTPAYASPEQAACERLDRRSDIYSMGVVLFYMLTATTPFPGLSVPQVLTAHINHKPPRLADACPSRSFPEEIEALVARLMAKRPSARPRTLAQLISEIDALLENVGLLAAPNTDAGRAGSLSSRSEADTVEVEDSEECSEDHGEVDEIDVIVDALEADGPAPTEDSQVWGVALEEIPSGLDWPLGRHLDVPGAVTRFPWTVTTDGRLIYLHVDGELKLVDSALDTEWAIELNLEGRPSAISLAKRCCYVGTDDGEVHEFSRSFDHRRHLWDTPDSSAVRDLACDDSGEWLTAIDEGGHAYSTRVDVDDDWHRLGLAEPAHTASVSSTGNRLAVMSAGTNISVFEAEQPHRLVCRVSVPAGIESFALDGDASRLICLTGSGDLAVLGVQEATWLHITSDFDNLVGVEVGPDGALVLVGTPGL